MPPTPYDLADRFYQLAPWNWMEETQLIAIEQPETGRRDHISIMGMNGNHRSLALYHGPVARQRFNLIQEERGFPQEDILTLILDTPQLQFSFSERGDLFKSELATIKQAGKKYRGESWPSFRTFHPGRCPIPASEAEIQWLCSAVQQVLEVAPTLDFGGDTFRFENGRREILTRRHINSEWRTEWTEDDATLFEFPRPAPDPFLAEKIRQQSRAIPMEIAFQQLPSPVGKSRETSVFPYLLLAVEPKSQFALGCNLLTIDSQSYEQLIQSVPGHLLALCDKNSIRPASIHVASPATHALLANTAAALGIRCDLKNRLPALDHALHSMMRAIGGGS